MTTGDNKISFSFSSTPFGSAPPPVAPVTNAPLSNLELLMAKAKAPQPAASTSKPKPKAPIKFDDDDEEDDQPVASSSKPKSKKPTPRDLLEGGASSHVNRNTAISRSEKKLQSEALALDSTAFQYDEVYDTLKAAERKVEEAKKMESDKREPKYMQSFLEAARRRKLDALHAEEKMMQIEREKEGGEFDDKEKFVTSAYKAQMEEVRRAEEEERVKEGEFATTLHKTRD
jgi:coiled-coil domain-containing protein 55